MPTSQERLNELLEEKKARVKIRSATLAAKQEEEEEDHDWSRFRGLSNEKIEKKLKKLPEKKMLEFYKKLERQCAYRIDPVNYRPHVIIRNFLLLWNRKLKDEEAAARAEKPLEAMTEKEIDRIMDDSQSSRVSSKPVRINKI